MAHWPVQRQVRPTAALGPAEWHLYLHLQLHLHSACKHQSGVRLRVRNRAHTMRMQPVAYTNIPCARRRRPTVHWYHISCTSSPTLTGGDRFSVRSEVLLASSVVDCRHVDFCGGYARRFRTPPCSQSASPILSISNKCGYSCIKPSHPSTVTDRPPPHPSQQRTLPHDVATVRLEARNIQGHTEKRGGRTLYSGTNIHLTTCASCILSICLYI